MWLLDANVDVHLAPVLSGFGISCDTASNRGWKALANASLVAAAVAADFDCILTRDQAFAESAARVLRSYPKFALVVLRLAQNRGRSISRPFSIRGRRRRSGRWPASSFNGPEVCRPKA